MRDFLPETGPERDLPASEQVWRPGWAATARGPWDDFDEADWCELACHIFLCSDCLKPRVKAWVDRRRPEALPDTQGPDSHAQSGVCDMGVADLGDIEYVVYSLADANVTDILEAIGPWSPEAEARANVEGGRGVYEILPECLLHLERKIGPLADFVALMCEPPAGTA